MNEHELWKRIRGGEPYFIAEAGVNHLGSFELAERLIREAALAGADAVKFQSYKADNLCVPDAPRFWDWSGEEVEDGSQFDSYSILDSFGENEHAELARLCKKFNVEFMSTPFDADAVDYLDRIGVCAYKVASCDVTNIPLLECIASKGKVVMLSTGASTIDEIEDAVSVLERGTSSIVIMHCNLKYPTADDEINLGMIDTLKLKWGEKYQIGLSDHTMNMWTPAIAFARGATVFERHFTVDKSLKLSADHWLSADPDDVRKILENVRFVKTLVGKCVKEPTPSEERARLYARRSIVAKREISVGELLTTENIACKRPGTGISPARFNELLGCRVTVCIKENELLNDGSFVRA